MLQQEEVVDFLELLRRIHLAEVSLVLVEPLAMLLQARQASDKVSSALQLSHNSLARRAHLAASEEPRKAPLVLVALQQPALVVYLETHLPNLAWELQASEASQVPQVRLAAYSAISPRRHSRASSAKAFKA